MDPIEISQPVIVIDDCSDEEDDAELLNMVECVDQEDYLTKEITGQDLLRMIQFKKFYQNLGRNNMF